MNTVLISIPSHHTVLYANATPTNRGLGGGGGEGGGGQFLLENGYVEQVGLQLLNQHPVVL